MPQEQINKIEAQNHSQALPPFTLSSDLRLSEVFQPFVDLGVNLTKFFSALDEQMRPLREALARPDVQEKLKAIFNHLRSNQLLQEHRWGLTPYIQQTELHEVVVSEEFLEYSPEEMEELFLNFFLKDNCYHLGKMVDSWFKNPLFEKRVENFKSIVLAIKAICPNEDKKTAEIAAYALIPTVISHIEGVCRDFSIEIGLIPTKGSKFKMGAADIEHWRVYYQLPAQGSLWAYLYWLDLFEKELFADSNIVRLKSQEKSEDKLTPESFNRHRILHGNVTDYGIPSNLIRLFLLLDFLSAFQPDNYKDLFSHD